MSMFFYNFFIKVSLRKEFLNSSFCVRNGSSNDNIYIKNKFKIILLLILPTVHQKTAL